MLRCKRVESTSPTVAVSVIRWDDETGEAEKTEYDHDGRLVRRAVVERFPRDEWLDDVVGEAVWFDADGQELRRDPVLLGRTLALD